MSSLLPVVAQDSEVVNSKSGISLNWSGTRGTDFAEEWFYYDQMICPWKVVYIKDTTDISMSHNAKNIAGTSGGSDDYESVSTSVGQIRYKVDGDQQFGMSALNWTAYSSAIDFAGLNYGLFSDSGTKVVGATGANISSAAQDNKTTRYWRGVLDSVGDEWHTITVADDDSAYSGSVEFKASDGKVFLFVVNPKTPCLTWRVTGNGQFYTTPAKNYYLPHIFDQTTYFNAGTGSVTVEIKDINGNNVFYRINGGSFTDAGSSSVTLDQDDFSTGSNTLDYYYAGNAAYTKTRTVVKNPAYPSAGETHGDRLWISASEWDAGFGADFKGNWWMDQWRTKDNHKGHVDITSNRSTGKRWLNSTRDYGYAIKNAFVARAYGMNYQPYSLKYSDAAKYCLLEAHTVLDPVGAEKNTSNNPIPTRELQYRGYYDVRPIYGFAGAYDILIGYYRADQGYANGITAIEDYYLRDLLARWVWNCGLLTAGYGEGTSFDTGGMWDTARKTGAAFIACMMPNYSAEAFGTSGMDGSTNVYSGVTFPTLNHTWRDLYIENDVSPVGYPDVNSKLGVDEYLWVDDGGMTKWHDRIPYAETSLMGQTYGIYYNLMKMYATNVNLPNLQAAIMNAANGQLYGTKFTSDSDRSPRFYSLTVMCNAWHPEFRAVAQPKALALSTSHSQHPGKQANTGGPFYVLWYDRDLPLGTGTKDLQTVSRVSTPTFSPPGGTYDSPQDVSIGTATTGAAIHYTLDGSDPDSTDPVFTSLIPVTANTTLKARAYRDDLSPSPVSTASFIFEVVGGEVAAPVIAPAGGMYIGSVPISMTCPTPDATIYYTLDGSTPTTDSLVYSSPFSLTSDTVVRARAFKTGLVESLTQSEIFEIGNFSSESSWKNVSFVPRTDVFVFSFDMMASDFGVDCVTGLSASAADGFEDLAAIIRFAASGLIDVRSNTWYYADQELAYQPGVKYSVSMVIDVTNHTYDVTITPEGGASVLIADNYAFRNSQATVSSLANLAFVSVQGNHLISNVRIESPGSKPSPPPNLRVLSPIAQF